MSADRQRLKSAIQRIAKEDPQIRNLLGEEKNKGGKASAAGVGTSEAGESRLCCDGSTSGNVNPGTEEREPDANEARQDGLDSSDPAKLSSGTGTLTGLTDCETGQAVTFEGSGWIPPDGWESPTEPGFDHTYKEGYYWQTASSDDRSATVKGSWDLWLPTCTANHCVTGIDACGNYAAAGANLIGVIEKDCLNDCRNIIDGVCYIGGAYYLTLQRGCDSAAENSASYCNPDESDIIAEQWPEDGTVNLAIIGGKIVGSKYDPENDGSYSAPRDSIDLCDSEGNQISLAPAANGGWKTINSTTDNGYLYDSSGEQIAHIDGNEYSDPSV